MYTELLTVLVPDSKTKPFVLQSTMGNDTLILKESYFEEDLIGWRKIYPSLRLIPVTDMEFTQFYNLEN